MDAFHQMNVFAAVVDSGGFNSAARKLQLSPAAVTRAVAELERRLGVLLLERSTRRVRATEAGLRYHEDCRRILADVHEANEAAAGLHGSPSGKLTVTAPVLFGGRYVMPLVCEFLQAHPLVEAQTLFVDRVVNLVDEGIDVAFRIGELPDSSLHALQVGQVRRVLCAAPAYLTRRGLPQHPRDLAAHELISAQGISPSSEWRFHAEGQALGVRVAPRLVTSTNDAALEAALAGFGITRLLSYQVAAALRDGRLKTVLADFEPAPLPVHVVHVHGRRASQRTRSFIDLAVQRLRSDPALN